MDEELRKQVRENWVGERVVVYPLNSQGETVGEFFAWLESRSDEGIAYRQQFYSDSLKRLMPGTLVSLPWERVGHVELAHDEGE